MIMVKWELIKIFRQKSLYLAAIILFSLFAYTIFANGYETEMTQKAYEKWEGPLTSEKVKEAEKLNAELAGYFSTDGQVDEAKGRQAGVIENIAYANNIGNTISEREKDLNKLIKQAEGKGEHALANKLRLQKSMYGKINVDRFSYHVGPVQTVDFVNVYGMILTGVFLLIGLSGIYANEHSSGVENYLLSAKNGRWRTMKAKLAAASIFAAVTIFSWEAFNLIGNALKYGTKGWDLPIQYSFKYYFSPYSFTFAEYHFIQVSIHLFAAIAFAAMIVVISTLAKSSLITLFIAGFLYGAPELFQSFLGAEQQWLNHFLRFTLTGIMKVEDLFMNFISLNVFGKPILAPFLGLAAASFVLVLSVILSSYMIRKKQIA